MNVLVIEITKLIIKTIAKRNNISAEIVLEKRSGTC